MIRFSWTRLLSKLDSWLVALLVLSCVNVVVFWDHLLRVKYFWWDFPLSYYAFVAWWTTMVQNGFSPEWVPFQQMGYPFMMNLQTGIFYPPLWLFPLTKTTYSMFAATLFEVLHVLLGSVGAFALGRLLFGKGLTPLFLGVGYHFFGGFYSNAEHIDIVRSWGWLPWLFWAAYLEPGQTKLAPRNVMLPLVVALHTTSSYPGNILSHLFIVGFLIVGGLLLKERPRPTLVAALLGLIAVGLLISAPELLPTWTFKDLLVRANQEHPDKMPWTTANWPFLLLPWKDEHPHVHDISMVSAFIPLPALLLLGLLRWASVTKLRAFGVVLVASLAMLPGEASFVSLAVRRLLPFMGYSRFPSSDYRGPLSLAMLVLASGALEGLLRASPADGRSLLRRRSWLFLALAFFFLTGQLGWVPAVRPLIALGLVFAASLATLWAITAGRERLRWAGAIGVIGISVVSGLTVIRAAQQTWSLAIDPIRVATLSLGVPPKVLAVLRDPPQARPPRTDIGVWDFSWRGYLEGSYQIRDLTGTEFNGHRALTADPQLKAWMEQGWEARVLAEEAPSSSVRCEALKAALPSPSDSRIRSTRYAVNRVTYDVHLEKAGAMVENETYFPGWTGTVERSDAPPENLKATPTCAGLRTWDLPAGDYRFTARFEMPNLRVSLLLSTMVTAAYAVLAGWHWRRNRKSRLADT